MTGPADSQSSPPASPLVTQSTTTPHLRRVLGLGDLVFYGIVLIQPVGAVGIFGLANQMSAGHVTATILIALVAMMLTAVSYGRMAGLYPVAGSAYTYVGRGLNVHLGFLAGWAMFLDYLVIPVVSVVFGADTMQRIVEDLSPGLTQKVVSALGITADAQHVGKAFWVIVFVVASTFLNLRGIKWTAWTNQFLTAVMCLIIGIFVAEAIRYLWTRQGWSGLISLEPFYNPKTFDLRAVGSATSLAALTYIGFDGITTLSEDVREPKRTVPLAIVLVCALIGLCAFLQVYLGQRVWPDYNGFKKDQLDTAFYDVCKLVGGTFLFNGMAVTMVIASVGSALTGQVGAARILFGMGRDEALPKFFARLDHHNNPAMNILLIGVVVLAASLLMNYEGAAELINFGAFLAFIGVNAAVIREFCFRAPATHKRNWIFDFVLPALGFLFCAAIWWHLPLLAKKVGGIWCGLGLLYTAIKTRGFRTEPKMIDLSGA